MKGARADIAVGLRVWEVIGAYLFFVVVFVVAVDMRMMYSEGIVE
jgi:hypothetical protein